VLGLWLGSHLCPADGEVRWGGVGWGGVGYLDACDHARARVRLLTPFVEKHLL